MYSIHLLIENKKRILLGEQNLEPACLWGQTDAVTGPFGGHLKKISHRKQSMTARSELSPLCLILGVKSGNLSP